MYKVSVIIAILIMSFTLSSCFTYTTVVGEGSKSNQVVDQEWNHYIFWGLAPVGVSDPNVLAGDSKDYNVKTEQSFVNGLLSALTLGIYAPTTTTITK